MADRNELEFLQSLAPPSPYWQGMGAERLIPDLRDFSMLHLPAIAEQIAAGLPSSYDLSSSVRVIEQQGSVPSCVAWSTGSLVSLLNYLNDQGWDRVAGGQLYSELGGNGSSGVDSRLTMEKCRSEGAPLVAGGRMLEIDSYFFAPQTPGAFRQAIAGAIASHHGAVVAVLLPTSFGSTSNRQVSSGYHQMLACAYTGLGDDDWCVFANSWGSSFGQGGFVRLNWGYLEANANQNGYCYSLTAKPKVVSPVPDPNPDPLPNPPPVDDGRRIIALTNAARTARGLTTLAEDPRLMASAAAKAQDMGVNQYFEHEHNGQGPLYWMNQAGVQNPTVWGENIAAGQTDVSSPGSGVIVVSAARGSSDGQLIIQRRGGAFTDWMNSPGHLANILFPGFTHMGAAHVQVPGSPYLHYYVQHFAGLGGPTPDPVPIPIPDPIPTPTPTRVFIKGEAKGGGLEFLAPGLLLQAAGGGFSGSVSVSEVTQEVSPTPEPEPEPQPPVPIPEPGPLPVRVVGRRRAGSQKLSLWGYVTMPPGATSATVGGTVNGSPLPEFVTGSNGIATWVVTATQPAAVVLSAKAGGISGTGTWQE